MLNSMIIRFTKHRELGAILIPDAFALPRTFLAPPLDIESTFKKYPFKEIPFKKIHFQRNYFLLIQLALLTGTLLKSTL